MKNERIIIGDADIDLVIAKMAAEYNVDIDLVIKALAEMAAEYVVESIKKDPEFADLLEQPVSSECIKGVKSYRSFLPKPIGKQKVKK